MYTSYLRILSPYGVIPDYFPLHELERNFTIILNNFL